MLRSRSYAPDSTQPGYLGPTTQTPNEAQLENFFHDVIAGVVDMDPTLVRPRWQPQPPTTPEFNIDWCGFGITHREADATAYVAHVNVPDGVGYDIFQRMERLTVMASFYGPNAEDNAALLRDGVFIDQNRALFRANGLGLIEVDDIMKSAELFRQQYRDRADLMLYLRREVRRTYQVRNILRARGPIEANPPGSPDTITDWWDTGEAASQVQTTWDQDWNEGGETVWDGPDEFTDWDIK
jgi:hypothetical protein